MQQPDILWLLVLTISQLGQAILIVVKLLREKNNKRGDRNYRVANNPHPCAAHGERLSALETDVKNLRQDNTDDHKVMFRAIEKLDERLDK